ncbi:hypothetical protein [Salsipaludibacter albus]|uniref:hypothetical protein n=1 Tax=Salsipaludibacter albus TaxID=2849650 RepID=UPI001EE44A00|nr:hypothetical protein [Salsipaludibacter albus]MBY5162567.1 hypothetical protein [Salsipaludibacter albus]
MDPHVHLRLTQARVDASLRRARARDLVTDPRPGLDHPLASVARRYLPRRTARAPVAPPDPACGPAT